MNTVSVDPAEHTAFLAIGSNLGDRLHHLRTAVEALRDEPEIDVRGVSPVYESAAHTLAAGETMPAFLNAVAEISTTLDPLSLLDRLHAIERATGRRREDDPKWAPRTLDLDLLIFDRDVIDEEQLTVPHPRLGARRFVLRPWADLEPHRYVPHPFDKTVGELLDGCPDIDRPVRTPFTL